MIFDFWKKTSRYTTLLLYKDLKPIQNKNLMNTKESINCFLIEQ